MPLDATLHHLDRLVAFDTTSRNSNLPLIDHVEAYLGSIGAACERVAAADGTKANLYATIGPADRPGIVLSGHTDTVPVDGQDWSSDPFGLARRDGRLFGRGTCDMKGFIAVCLALAPEMTRADLKAPIHFAFSYDEEVGCLGVRGLLDMLASRPVKPFGCVVGEPTSMEVVIAHKSKRSFHVCVRGAGGHSARAPECVNAVEYAASLVTKTTEIGRRLAAEGLRDALYDIPHSTAHVGIFRGGVALNIVPDEATVEFEFRVLPEEDADVLVAEFEQAARAAEAEMRKRDPRSRIDIALKSEIPGLAVPPDADIVTLAKSLAGRNDHAKVAYGTEAGLFVATADIPTVVCGPGSIAQAHKADEYVSEEQLAGCERFVRNLIRHCAS